MKVGTRSFLFGAHCFFIHPVFVLIAWTKLYGFPLNPKIWLAIFLHDIGYIGKPNMDGIEGKYHPMLGAKIMGWLFGYKWHIFMLAHSRSCCECFLLQPSKLCFADKLSICYEPSWFYLLRAKASGEIKEYRQRSLLSKASKREWRNNLVKETKEWVYQNYEKKT